MKKRAFYIFLICYLSYVFIYVARLNLSMAAPSLKELSVLTTAQIGLLGSLFSVIYACGRLLSGIIGDHTPPWKMISLGLIFCGISNLCIGLFPPFYLFFLLWGVNAFAQSMLWGAILRTLSAIYPGEVAKRRASYMSTAVASGNLLAILMNSILINDFGAQWAFLIPGGITLILSTLVFLFTKAVASTDSDTPPQSYGLLLRHKTLRQMLIPAVVHGVMKDNISLWMTVYIMDYFGIDLNQSANFILLIPTLGFIGRLATPTLYRFSNDKEKPLLLGSFILCATCSALLILFPFSACSVVVYLSLIYMAVSVINACFLSLFPIQFAKEGHVASVSGIMDFATYLGTGLSAMVYGVMIESFGYESMYLSWVILSLFAIPILLHKKKSQEVQ